MTAKDLLLKYLDYQYLWVLPQRIDSRPGKVRLAQIESLQEAFGLSKGSLNPNVKMERTPGVNQYLDNMSNIEYLKQGLFLGNRPYEENRELVDEAIERVRVVFGDIPESRKSRPVGLGLMFNDLLSFRQKIFEITYPSHGMLEGFSIGLYYSQTLQADLKGIILEHLASIDITLTWI